MIGQFLEAYDLQLYYRIDFRPFYNKSYDGFGCRAHGYCVVDCRI